MITITAFRNLVKQSVEDNDTFVYLGEPQSHAILCKGISEGAYDYSYAYELSFSVDDYECFVEDLAKMLGYPKIDDSYREGALYTIATPLHPIFLITPDDRNVVDSSVCATIHAALIENGANAKFALHGTSAEIYTALNILFSVAQEDGCVVFE